MEDLLPVFREWVLAISVVIATFVVAAAVGAFLRRWKDHKTLDFLSRLAKPVSYLVYPVGLRIAADVAPLHPKADLWIQHVIYVAFVLAFLNLVRQSAMIAIDFSAMKVPRGADAFQHGFVPLMRNMVTLIVFMMGGIMLLKYFGYDVMSLITALGVGSLAVGLAAKDTLSNMISGFTLIIDRNLRPGDKINLGGSVGVVDEIGLRSTRLNIRDGNILVVPNQDLVNTKILNMTMEGPASACSTRFRVPLSVPFAKIKGICQEIHPQVVPAIPQKGGWVQLASISDGNQLITTGFWVVDSDKTGDALTDFHIRLVERLSRENIPLLGEPIREVKA
ncbi:MAG: mechanosensitive ion channel family protein [Bdellovibrionia bacterium]